MHVHPSPPCCRAMLRRAADGRLQLVAALAFALAGLAGAQDTCSFGYCTYNCQGCGIYNCLPYCKDNTCSSCSCSSGNNCALFENAWEDNGMKCSQNSETYYSFWYPGGSRVDSWDSGCGELTLTRSCSCVCPGGKTT